LPLVAVACLAAVDVAAQLPAPPLPPVRDPNDKSQAAAPTGHPGLWVTNDDYPERAMREEREGVAGFRLTIDANGLPTDCEITTSSGHADLDAATCTLVRERSRFTPARDRRGKPIVGTYSNRIIWQIPGLEEDEYRPSGFIMGNASMAKSLPRAALPESGLMMLDADEHYPAAARAAGEQGMVRMTLNIDIAGTVTGCAVTDGSGSRVLDDAACALMRDKGRFLPALDIKGQPTPALFAAEWNWILPPESDAADAAVAGPRRLGPFPLNSPGSMTVAIVIDREGGVADCQDSSSGFAQKTPDSGGLCSDLVRSQRYEPFRDAAGNPVARRITLRTDVTIADADAAPAQPSGNSP
jgi:TonB family protein